MTADLAAWLVGDDGPIAEDELVARVLLEKTRGTPRWYVDDDGCLEQANAGDGDWGEPGPRADGSDRLPNHHNTWALVLDPAHELAECAAKRAIVETYRTWLDRYASDEDDQEAVDVLEVLDGVVSALAQPCAGRAGWREEWGTT